MNSLIWAWHVPERQRRTHLDGSFLRCELFLRLHHDKHDEDDHIKVGSADGYGVCVGLYFFLGWERLSWERKG